MSEIYDRGSEGVRALTRYLGEKGRKVEASNNKTFDLRVDGVYAEVKSTRDRYSKLGFIGLTDNQFAALEAGVEFILFIVCNLQAPKDLEVIEITSAKLRAETPKKECTYYWYRSQLERLQRKS